MMYLFYIDESGTPAKNPSLPKERKNIFAVVAVGMLDHNWWQFNDVMREYKRKLYKRDSQKSPDCLKLHNYEVKSTLVRHAQDRAKSPFLQALSKASIKKLVEKYYAQLAHNKMILLGVVIDLDKLTESYDSHQVHNKAMELLYEQIEILMRQVYSRHKAIVIADDNGKTRNYRIAAQHADFLRTQTTDKIKLMRIVETPLFTLSELSEGIQLADLCVYNVYRAFTYDDMNDHYFKKILPRFHRFPGAESDITNIIKVFPDADKRFPRLI